MKKDGREVLALFGSVQIPRMFCPYCQALALVLRGEFACCGEKCPETPERWKRESECVDKRRTMPLRAREEQLSAQAHRCLYCERRFGSQVLYRKKLVKLVVHWDHIVPFTYNRDNRPENFAAACQICNGVKGSKCFQTVEEARIYVQSRLQLSVS